MKTSPISRLVAAAASVCVTWTLLTAVTMLAAPAAEPQQVAHAGALVVR